MQSIIKYTTVPVCFIQSIMNRIHLTDDMLLYLAKYYITERDCLALALSGVSERFTQLYGSNRLNSHICIL